MTMGNQIIKKQIKEGKRRKKEIIIEQILDLIYPQICSICGKLNPKSLCNKCKTKLEAEYNFKIDDYTQESKKNFIEHYYFFKYEKLIRSQILSLKFKEKPYIYKTIAYFLENKQKSLEKLKKYDIIVVVPVSKGRFKERGYNQSELIAKEIAKILSIKIEKKIIYKIKEIPPQSTLNKEQREENIKQAYIVKNIKKIKDKKILIFDDIYTTGNTVNECARILIEAGINRKNIGVLTIAKD